MKYLKFAFILAGIITAKANNLFVNVNMTVTGNTAIIVKDMDVTFNQATMFDKNTVLYVRSDKNNAGIVLSGENVTFEDIVFETSAMLDFDSITVTGNMSFNNGVINLTASTLNLAGTMNNENESHYITASSGGVIVRQTMLTQGENNNLGGMGIEITAKENSPITIVRHHESEKINDKESIRRVYRFSEPLAVNSILAKYHSADDNVTQNMTMYYHDGSTWNLSSDIIFSGNSVSTSSIIEPVEAITLVGYPDLDYPLFLSSERQVFEIVGNELHENPRLVVLSSKGVVLFDRTPYKNDLHHSELLPGRTYYYMYYINAKEKPVKKSSFEVLQ